MANDLKTTEEADLDMTNGLQIASDREADRFLLLTRSMTIRGEVPYEPGLGVPDWIIGRPITNGLIEQIKVEVLKSLKLDQGLENAFPTVKVVPQDKETVIVFIQSNRDYSADGLGKLTVAGDYWSRNEEQTLLDGTQG